MSVKPMKSVGNSKDRDFGNLDISNEICDNISKQ